MTKVLIVDDSKEMRGLLKLCFSTAGFGILEAATGSEAVQAFDIHHPSIIILDLTLPDMDGLEVCSKIRAKPFGTTSYIMMLTARAETEDKVYGLEHGADAYLTKPINPQEVMAQLRVGLRTVEDRRNNLQDPLTGTFGRRAFDLLIEHSIARNRRHDSSLALAKIDIDNFKKIGDTHGSETASAILQEFSDLLQRHSRQSDLYFRLSGNEFAWLLTEADEHGALIATERFRTAVEGHRFNKTCSLTVSIGVTELCGREDSTSLCRRADDALYSAKDAGGNRIESSQAPQSAMARA